jgi:hypothetical protein
MNQGVAGAWDGFSNAMGNNWNNVLGGFGWMMGRIEHGLIRDATRQPGQLGDKQKEPGLKESLRKFFGYEYEEVGKNNGDTYQNSFIDKEGNKVTTVKTKSNESIYYIETSDGKLSTFIENKDGIKQEVVDGGIIKIGKKGELSVVNLEDVKNGSAIFTNGVSTHSKYALDQARAIQEDTQKELYLVYNGTDGSINDFQNAINNMQGEPSNEKSIDTIKNLLMNGKVNLLLGHSQGGLIQALALKDASSLANDEMRNQINKVQLFTFGTPLRQSILPNDFSNAISIHNDGDIPVPLPLQREYYPGKIKFYPGKGYGHDIENYIYDIREIRRIKY